MCKIQHRFSSKQTVKAVYLYHQAFGDKIAIAVKNKPKRLELLSDSLNPDFAFVAIDGKNELVGIAGFQTVKGSLTNGITYKQLIVKLGFLKGHWAAIIFILFDRKLREGQLLMDGISVDVTMRSKGIGTKLLNAIKTYALDNKFETIRLDVIDTNPRAKKLYLSLGFKVIDIQSFPYLKKLLGFSGVTTLEYKI